jgi:hypothetical protein
MALGQRFYVDTPQGTFGFSQGPSLLTEVTAINTSGGLLWLQLFMGATPPVLGDIPQQTFRVADGQTISVAPPGSAQDPGRPFAAGAPPGMGIWWSTTQETFTPPPAGPEPGPIYAAGRDLA